MVRTSVHIILDEDGRTLRLYCHERGAIESICKQVVGRDFMALTTKDKKMGSGIELVPLDGRGVAITA